MSPHGQLAFSAVVGQETAKRALTLAAIQPRLAGVLLRGDKGSGKTTLARGLAALLPGGAPFVELPLGATEERVIGSLDLGELLTNGRPQFRPGLLAAAHGGVLYVDEINLLADHLVDALLDVAVSGINRVERDGLSHAHPARFVLVASMNPEEGELRPQLLDRFGLAVDVSAPSAVADRSLAVRRQLTAETSMAGSFVDDDAALMRVIAAARAAEVAVGDDVIGVASALAVAVGAEGLRADLMLCRAAAASAALDGRTAAEIDDVRAVAEMVLAHRRRRRPLDEPGISKDELDQAWEQAQQDPRPSAADGGDDQTDAPDVGNRRLSFPDGSPTRSAPRTARAAGGFDHAAATRGRFVRAQPFDAVAGGDLDAHATAIAVAERRATTGSARSVEADDLRTAQREQRRGSLVVFAVDASASMGVEHRMAATKGAIIGLLGDAYRRRGRVALVTFRGDAAEVVLRPTASVEIAKARLTDLATGGTTPLAAGLDATRELVHSVATEHARDCHVVVITDGRATAGDDADPVAASHAAAARLASAVSRVIVIDTENGHTRLGLARALAESIGAQYVHLDALGTSGLESAVRATMGG